MIGSTGWAVTPGVKGWLCGKMHGDGSMSVYKFQTQEWAELCKRSMERLDKWENERRWGTSLASTIIGYQGQITSAHHLLMTRFELEGKNILQLDHNREVIKFDVPAIIYLWLKTTWIPKFFNRLMWGTKGKQ
jgi:hypothetical protein